MSNKILNQISFPNTYPVGATGSTGHSGPAGPTGDNGATGYNTGSPAGSGHSTSGAGVAQLPNGAYIIIPYTGWYTYISIPPATEKVKAKKKDDRDGCDCIKCEQFFQFAEPNQEDGTLICWACRHGY